MDFLKEAVPLVTNVRYVTQLVVSLVDAVPPQLSVEPSRETAVAAGLEHEVSKLYEFIFGGISAFKDYLPHPHYGVHLLAAAKFSCHL